MPQPIRVLVAGSPDDDVGLIAELRRAGFDPSVLWVETAEGIAIAQGQGPWDAVLAYDRQPDFDAIATLRQLGGSAVVLPVIVISAGRDIERAADLMRSGAKDCVAADNLSRLGSALKRELIGGADERAHREAKGTQYRPAASLDNWVRRLELQIQRLPLAYLVIDDKMRVLEWNPAAEKTFGYSKDEIVGRELLSLIFPRPLHHHVLDFMRGLCQEDVDVHRVYVNRTKKERTVTCKWYNTPLVDTGETFVGAICLAQDVTEHEALEEQLRQSQKLEAIGQLAAGVAHDFGGFATSINICTHLLKELLNPETQVRQLLNEISKAAERSTSLTRQLLAFSSQQALAPRIVSLNDVIRDAEDMLRRLLADNVNFGTMLDPSVDPVLADPSQIERVLFNLVVNARDAMPDGGRLLIETTTLTLDDLAWAAVGGLPPGRYTVLVVTDSGSGVSDEIRHRIFEPFFTTKEPGRASGLGLAVVHGIVKQSGGHIAVDSQPEEGACFRIYLPSATANSSVGCIE